MPRTRPKPFASPKAKRHDSRVCASLREAIQGRSITLTELSKRTEIPFATLTDFFYGRVDTLPASRAGRLAAVLGLNAEQIGTIFLSDWGTDASHD